MLAPLPLGYFRIWCQNLVPTQAPVVYETSVDADPFGKLRPRFFPRERLVCFRCGVEWVEQTLSEPRLPHNRRVLLQSDELTTVHCLPCLPISTAPDRREGSLLTPPTQCLRQFSRGLPLTLVAHVGFEPRL